MSELNSPHTWTIGCVRFLNSRPLIDGLDVQDDIHVRFDVPSRLVGELLAGQTDVALCPVIDYQLAEEPLRVVPVGGIACDGPTHTVRLFSRCPIDDVRIVHADTDSHTSVNLMRIILHDQYGLTPQVVSYDADAHDTTAADAPQTMLLIGDKVENACPSSQDYPHQLDLGSAWKRMTGLPFVFAVWMTRMETDLGDLPQRMAAQREANRSRTEELARMFAPRVNLPIPLAVRYLGELLRYETAQPQLEAMQQFWSRAYKLGLISQLRPMVLYEGRAIDQGVQH